MILCINFTKLTIQEEIVIYNCRENAIMQPKYSMQHYIVIQMCFEKKGKCGRYVHCR